MSSVFWWRPFVPVFENLGGKVSLVDDVLSFFEHEIFPTTSLDESSIEFAFQTDRNYYIDLRQMYFALKLKFIKGQC